MVRAGASRSGRREAVPKRARAHFELVPLELVFKSSPGDSTFICGALCNDFFEKLKFYGYILGENHSAHIDADRRHVRARAVFIGKDAWPAALANPGMIENSFGTEAAFKNFKRAISLAKPGVLIPVCKCGRKSDSPLDLLCTPLSKAPPLLCSKGGVIQFWKLPLSIGSLIELERWRRTTELLADLAIYPDPPNRLHGECPHHAQAKSWLVDKAGWLANYSNALALRVENEIGRHVRAWGPPYHVLRL